MNLVFVYGSLKKGFGNQGFLANSEFISTGVLHNANLYSLGAYPAVTFGVGVVKGEIYDVGEETLRSLDMLEGHPHHYQRQTHLVLSDNHNGNLPCHVYIYQGGVLDRNLIECGEWKHEHIRQQGNALWSESA